MFDSLQVHELWHARLPCPSLSPGVCPSLCPLSQWCHSTISSSFTPFSSCTQSFPSSGSFPMNWLFTSGGQSTGASASASVLSMNIRVDFLSDWLVGSLWSPRESPKSLLQHHSSKSSIVQHSAFFMVQLSYPHMTTGKNIAFDYT